MPIKIIKEGDDQGDLYTAEVTAKNGTWRSPHPMPSEELRKKLISLGHGREEVRNALHAGGVGYCPKTLKLARMTQPLLQAALAGEREVPEQRPSTEAWLAYALPKSDRMLSLIQVIGNANFTKDDYPTSDEISWAFLRLRRRGWLVVEGEMYGLTPEGKRTIKKIEYDKRRWPGRLVEWMANHPLPGDDKALIWRAESKVGAKDAESEYRRLEKIYLPFLQATLAGERELPPKQRPRNEVWFALALYRHDGMSSLWEVIGSIDEFFDGIPHYDDVSWAFLRLRRRGWLMVDGERFGLTSEGRHIVQDICNEDNGLNWEIQKWSLKHPLPGDE